jgi:hypothetical protein
MNIPLAVPRRYVLLILAVCVTLLVFHQAREFESASRVPGAKNDEYLTTNHGFSPWNRQNLHYPLNHLIPLPTGRPKRLPLVQHAFGTEILRFESSA